MHCHSIDTFSYFLQITNEYDKVFDPNVFIGHCDHITGLSDFALYLDNQLIYEYTAFIL